LYLCKELVELLGGTIWLDESYNSGVPGYDGTRFVIDLNTPPVQFFSEAPLTHHDDPLNGKGPSTIATESEHELPEKLSVLFVDDDMVLRKLFARSVRKVAPGWIVREASSGEAALLLTDSESFDLIFMDQYMASVERQLLGTETVSVLRAKGVACRICGLSANDMEDEFIKVGAHAFMFKPFPCESNALINELHRILEE
jgi:CheY-like chemotaxis protein